MALAFWACWGLGVLADLGFLYLALTELADCLTHKRGEDRP